MGPYGNFRNHSIVSLSLDRMHKGLSAGISSEPCMYVEISSGHFGDRKQKRQVGKLSSPKV